MRYVGASVLAVLVATSTGAAIAADRSAIVVGSKRFNESYILAEIMAQLLEDRGRVIDRRFGLAGTLICYEALRKGEIDVYPEYSGTLEQAILKLPRHLGFADLQQAVAQGSDVELLGSFGFDNTYAIAVRRETAQRLRLTRIGDLAAHPDLRLGFSHEFLNRNDGWPGLAETYELTAAASGIEHGLAYQALVRKELDVTDVYSTDGDILKFDLALLDDDRGYFPRYMAAPLVTQGLDPAVKAVLGQLAGRIDDERMRELNGRVLLEGHTFAQVARQFLSEQGLIEAGRAATTAGWWTLLLRRTITHLELTLIALVAAILVAVPAGTLVYRLGAIARPAIYVAGLLQTIPSIALLAFMIPLLGIGARPAIAALFLYGLLPILRNTATGLFAVDPLLKRVSVGMGLTSWQRLRHVELPLAAPTILAGIKTAAVINIGTATLAAFIGAGGLGEPIVTGLALNDPWLILEGAVPAAILAVLVEFAFELLERVILPRHLRVRPTGD